uniref:Uncharacterized protein n=1 Tax=Chromera velia CCMP2878 TaxID=1169474 RepID=A0A0G4HYI0_9ALVE|eukprot:Cvel_33593.t1-p1 / transcript=Cvel_33593.t1 / gene=Cvel_33593 / organism=Chromera_velia_CCMP2878 / gene_product=hypothetical protein / transcript_product=hypothetical protein / location=Cvel_scaffold5496:230-3389(-) / protein_length=312 / sequence_SO=supercontig / SO=protein_coding / is_pseudo=false
MKQAIAEGKAEARETKEELQREARKERKKRLEATRAVRNAIKSERMACLKDKVMAMERKVDERVLEDAWEKMRRAARAEVALRQRRGFSWKQEGAAVKKEGGPVSLWEGMRRREEAEERDRRRTQDHLQALAGPQRGTASQGDTMGKQKGGLCFFVHMIAISAGVLTMAPNAEGEFKTPIRFEREAPENVTRVLAGRFVREGDSMSEDTDEKAEKKAREGEFKTPIRFEREAPENVTRVLAGRFVREGDSMSEDTDEKAEKKAREVAEASAVLVRFLEGCGDFPPYTAGGSGGGGESPDREEDGCTPPTARV